MNVRMLRAFAYWCSATCLLLFAVDLSTQQVAANKNVSAETSLSSRFNFLAHSVGQSSVFVAHALHAGAIGGTEAVSELIPYLIDTSVDVTRIVCTAIAHPIDTFEKCRDYITNLAVKITDYFATLDWETIKRYQRIVSAHYVRYCNLPAEERGEIFGSLVGYHVMDFYGGTIAIKTLFHVKNYACVSQLIQRKSVSSFMQMQPTERVKGFAVAVNQATRRERYMYDLKHSLSEPHTRSYALTNYDISNYDAMRILLECSSLRAVGVTYTGVPCLRLQAVAAS